MLPDAEAGNDALGPYEAPEPADPDTHRLIRELVARSGFEAGPSSHGWRMIVPLQLDRKQAVYVGPTGADLDGRAVVSLVSVCGTATVTRPLLAILMKLPNGCSPSAAERSLDRWRGQSAKATTSPTPAPPTSSANR